MQRLNQPPRVGDCNIFYLPILLNKISHVQLCVLKHFCNFADQLPKNEQLPRTSPVQLSLNK